jgi:hypothetical protein
MDKVQKINNYNWTVNNIQKLNNFYLLFCFNFSILKCLVDVEMILEKKELLLEDSYAFFQI